MLHILYIFERSFCINTSKRFCRPSIFPRSGWPRFEIMYVRKGYETIHGHTFWHTFCPFSVKHDQGRHFWSSWNWERLLAPTAQIQDGGNENTLDCNIFHVYPCTSHDILILMFCTSLGQCKVHVRCICWTAVRRKLLIFLKFSFQNFWSHNDSLYNQLYWTEVESFEIIFPKISQFGHISEPCRLFRRVWQKKNPNGRGFVIMEIWGHGGITHFENSKGGGGG